MRLPFQFCDVLLEIRYLKIALDDDAGQSRLLVQQLGDLPVQLCDHGLAVQV